MNYYVVKNVSDVTQPQLNVSGARSIDNVRKNNLGTKCVLEFSAKEYSSLFMNDEWLTIDELRPVLEGSEWGGEPAGFIGRTLAALGF